MEEKKSALENQLANPEVYSNGEKAKAVQQEIQTLEEELASLNEQWEAEASKLE